MNSVLEQVFWLIHQFKVVSLFKKFLIIKCVDKKHLLLKEKVSIIVKSKKYALSLRKLAEKYAVEVN